MAKVKPFRAVRPTRDKVALVTTRSYELYDMKERRSILKYNPFSFLHILEPGFKFNKVVKGLERFRLVNNRFLEFKENQIFQKEEKPVYYLHEKSFGEHVYWGIIAVCSVEDYENAVIKKHENTLAEREKLFGHYLEVAGFNAEPVLITYPNQIEIDHLYNRYKLERAEYEFTTNKKRKHQLWIIDNPADIALIEKTFDSIPQLYIADGHHRSASSHYLKNLLKSKNKGHTGNEFYNYFMTYLIPESNLQITSFDRFIKKLNMSKEDFLVQLDAYFRIENLGNELYRPSKKHHFSMYLDGDYFKLYLRSEKYNIENALDELDAQVLYKTILKPILKIDDLSADKNIVYIPEKENLNQLKTIVDEKKYAVGFGLFPVTTEQLKAVADAKLTMPPKSTYIQPKLRSGLTIYELTE
ncbi:DUF1015 domain-containing protein [Namhaeicola litoreus]|uniref:DUF1015 domain-containing protein n=1 Tax=Namhaeicola litoreus TaxID=1052145 RepID=A0ABW3Y2Q7_9FLAO